MGRLIVVDCEAPFGVGSPSVGDMTEFGGVDVNALREGRVETFHGADCARHGIADPYTRLGLHRSCRAVSSLGYLFRTRRLRTLFGRDNSPQPLSRGFQAFFAIHQPVSATLPVTGTESGAFERDGEMFQDGWR